jgi:EAL domain-containing protein (putative c-di-GMP-specific phosphodiesterase class I)
VLGAPAEIGEGYAVDRARRLTAEIARPCQVAGVAIAVEVSAGVVVERAGACDMTELVRRADVALHHAKQDDSRLGRYETAQDAFNTDRLALLADLRDALAAGDQFELHLQPTVDLQTGEPIGAEALTRWRHPRRGLLQPAEFIGVVEHSDLAGAFTLHVIDMALRLASGWASQGLHLPISVNLCARCTVNPTCPRWWRDRLAAHGVPARRLVLEITETVAMTEPGLAERVVTRLRELGVRVSGGRLRYGFGLAVVPGALSGGRGQDRPYLHRHDGRLPGDRRHRPGHRRPRPRPRHDRRGRGGGATGAAGALVELGVGAAQGFLFHRPLPPDELTPVLQGRTHTATAKRIPIVRSPSRLTSTGHPARRRTRSCASNSVLDVLGRARYV